MKQFKTSVSDGAGLVCLSGPVTEATMRELRREVVRLAFASGVLRVLCDLSAAAPLLDEVEWARFSRESASRHAMGVAVGYLVLGPTIEHVRNHCDRLNRRGRVGLAFMTSKSAYRWLDAPQLSPGVCRPEAVAQD